MEIKKVDWAEPEIEVDDSVMAEVKKKISSVDKVNKGRTKNFCYTLNCLRELVCFSGLRMSLFISTSRQRSLQINELERARGSFLLFSQLYQIVLCVNQ